MKYQASTTEHPFPLALAATSLLIFLGAFAPLNYNAPAGVDPCGRLTAASVKTAIGLDTHVADGYGRLPAPPIQGPPATTEKKRQLLAALTATYAEVMEIRPDTIRVVLHELPRENWSVAGISWQIQARMRQSADRFRGRGIVGLRVQGAFTIECVGPRRATDEAITRRPSRNRALSCQEFGPDNTESADSSRTGCQ